MSIDEPVKTTKTEGTDWTAKVWDFLTSLKLVLFLLLILSAVSIVGTIIQQNKPLQMYYRSYDPGTVDLFNKLGLDRDEINFVRKMFARLNRGDIRIDKDSFNTVFFQRFDCL